MPSAGSGRAVARLRIRSDARELRKLRQQLRDALEANHIDPVMCDDLILVANELSTNAIEASALGSDVAIELRVNRTHVTLTVENIGPPFTIPDSLTLPPGSHLRGRGLALSRMIAGELSSERTVDGTRVIARYRRV